MSLSFDVEFEEARLDQLVAQCLLKEDIRGKVVFMCASDQALVCSSTWCFSDSDMFILIESGYRTYLLELLSIFTSYRSKFEGLEYRGGVFSLEGHKSSINWISESEVKKLINE